MDTDTDKQVEQQHQQQFPSRGEPDHVTMARALNEIVNIHLTRGNIVPMMRALNKAIQLYRAAGLSLTNMVVSGVLYVLDLLCLEAVPLV